MVVSATGERVAVICLLWEKKLKFAKVLKYVYEMSFAQRMFLVIRLTRSGITDNTYSEYQILD